MKKMSRPLFPVVAALLFLLFARCHTCRIAGGAGTYRVQPDTTEWLDASRDRKIPLAFYRPLCKQKKEQRWIIVSHGYGANQGGDYLHYSYLCEFLASKGCQVVSIQHELPTDSLLPMAGIPQVTRRTNWERGAQNILFVLQELKKQHPDLDYRQVVLIGHSNGGDMSALFAHRYPTLLGTLITLDNRRLLLPRNNRFRTCSLRSSDQPADRGVLPAEQEQQQYHMIIIQLPATLPNEMDDKATQAQRKEITGYLWQFITGT